MNIREEQEKYEHEHLSRFASFSDESQGRDRPEEPCTVRPACLLYTSTKHLRNGDEYEINNRKFGILYNPCYHVLHGDRVYTDEHGRKQGK